MYQQYQQPGYPAQQPQAQPQQQYGMQYPGKQLAQFLSLWGRSGCWAATVPMVLMGSGTVQKSLEENTVAVCIFNTHLKLWCFDPTWLWPKVDFIIDQQNVLLER